VIEKLRAVGLTCGIGSLLVGARQAGFDVVGNVEWRRYYFSQDALGRNTFKENFPGAVFKNKIDDLTPQEIERIMNPALALSHPESHPDAPMFTSRGWKMASEIRRGDLVLTHRGRFRRVLAVYRRRPGPDTEKITLSRNSRQSGTALTLAGNHPVLMGDGSWRRAAEVRKGETIVHLCETCQRCGELSPVCVSTGNASCFCHIRKFWKTAPDEIRRARLRPAHTATKLRVSSGDHDFTNESVRRKGQLVQARRSSAEDFVIAALDDTNLVRQYAVGPYFIDLAIPELKIGIEVDGGSWHKIEKKKRQDEKKKEYLNKEGWIVVRVAVRNVKSVGINKNIEACVAEVRRLAMNHRGEYKFSAQAVGGLWRGRFDDDEVLYDFSVEEDNSYVLKSYVVHNCGKYSQLSSMNRDQSDDPGDIPLFTELVGKIRPRFFAMDDLPKSLGAYPMSAYAAALPDYDLFPEWVSNYHYGNIQKNRKRMFMIGALKSERWAFVAGERGNGLTLKDIIEDLGEPRRGSNFPNHDPHVLDENCGRAKHLVTLGRDQNATYADIKRFFLANPPGTTLKYFSKHDDGSGGLVIKHKPSHSAGYWDAHTHVLDGASIQVHPHRGLPYTIRERARIQGFPDDFVFYGTRLNDRGEWNHEKNNDLVKQTGKAMPVQFGRYVSEQVMAHILDEPFETSGQRLIPANEYVDHAKKWYCESVGYSNQPRACAACWLYSSCTIRMRKYNIGAPGRGQLDLIDSGVVPGADIGEIDQSDISGGAVQDLDFEEAPNPQPVSRPRKKVRAVEPRPQEALPARSRSARFADLPAGAEKDLSFDD
jgi:site-specific DNA-cytosine methylase/very-short-patch-repair endonuclease